VSAGETLPSPPLLRRFFGGLVEHAFFERLGVPDPRLADYLADLLCRFVRMDAIFGVRDLRGRPLEEVAEMLAEAGGETLSSERERAIHKHVGDFVLFWMGVYPEFLRRLRAASRKDHLVDYMAQARRSYHIASTFDREPFRREAEILRRLSAELELCVFGLSLVREGWESLSAQSYRGLRRQW
jgi:hypothetical protein